MTIETYYNFVKIIKCGNILAASQELMIAQPALSTQLKNLENTLGVKLVERGCKKISLTPAGEIFYAKALDICALDTSMHEELQNYMQGIEGTLKLSMTPSNPSSLLHFLFDDFVRLHPKVNFQFREALSPQIAEYVRSGLSEIGITRSVLKNADDFHSIPFRTEELRVIVSEDHPLAQFDSLTLEQIKNEPIATTEVIAPRITQAFETINCEPNFYLRTAFKRTAIFWSSSYKNCITLLPCTEDELDPEHSHCRLLRITDYDFIVKRSIILLKNRKLSPIARDFLASIHVSCDFPDV